MSEACRGKQEAASGNGQRQWRWATGDCGWCSECRGCRFQQEQVRWYLALCTLRQFRPGPRPTQPKRNANATLPNPTRGALAAAAVSWRRRRRSAWKVCRAANRQQTQAQQANSGRAAAGRFMRGRGEARRGEATVTSRKNKVFQAESVAPGHSARTDAARQCKRRQRTSSAAARLARSLIQRRDPSQEGLLRKVLYRTVSHANQRRQHDLQPDVKRNAWKGHQQSRSRVGVKLTGGAERADHGKAKPKQTNSNPP